MRDSGSSRSSSAWRPRLAVLLMASLAVGFAPGCSSSDNSDGGGGMTTVPCVQLINTTIPTAGTVVAEQDTSSGECDFLFVDLIVSDVDDLFAANFDVVYPSGLLQFLSGSDVGSVLTSGGIAVSIQAQETTVGRVTIGISRLATTNGVNVNGGQRLIRLSFFRLATSGSAALTFENTQLLDSDTPPVEIPASGPWSGGTVAIVQV